MFNKYSFLLLLLIGTPLIVWSQEPAPQPRGDYLGQVQPGDDARLFAPGFISVGLNEREASFSNDGGTCYFWAIVGGFTVIFETSRQQDGVWSQPRVAPFSGVYADFEPCFSADNQQLFFCSARPLPGQSSPRGTNIWVMERKGKQWGEPRPLSSAVNTAGIEYFPSLTRDGTLYFGRYSLDQSRSNFYRARLKDENRRIKALWYKLVRTAQASDIQKFSLRQLIQARPRGPFQLAQGG